MTSKRVQQGRPLGHRRFPRTEIVPDVKPTFTLDSQLLAMTELGKIPPTWCEGTFSGLLRPGDEYAMPGFQFCALRHGHDGPHLVDAWDGTRFWYDEHRRAASWDGKTWDRQ